MEITNLINTLKAKFPEDAMDIGVAIELLANSIRSLKSTIGRTLIQLHNENKFDDIQEFLTTSKQIADILNLLDTYADNLNIDDTADIDEDEYATDKKVNKVNYSKYRIDDKMPYNLYHDYAHTKPAAFVIDEIKIDASRWQDLYLKTCEYLYKKNKDIFLSFLTDDDMQGRSRAYISDDDKKLFKPKAIGGGKIFLETNLSANGIRNIIVKLLDKYSIPRNTYQIFLRADYSPLHKD